MALARAGHHLRAMARLFPFRGSKQTAREESFSVVEVRPSGGAPARFLIGKLGADAEPLEEASTASVSERIVPSVAADDHGVLASLLEEVTLRGPADWEGMSGGMPARAWNLGGDGLKGRMEEALDSLEIRPLATPATAETLAAVAPLSDPALRWMPIHRGLRDLPTFNEQTFLQLVGAYARIYDLEVGLDTADGRRGALDRLAALATGHHAFLLALPGGRAKILRVRQALELSTIRAVPRSPTLRSLDLVLLEALILRTTLGIQEPDRPNHPQVATVSSFEQLVDDVEAGRLQAGFALNPPPAWELRAVIEARQKLPPKTVQLEPTPPPDMLRYLQS